MSDHTPTPWKYEAPQGAFGHEVVGASRLVCQMSHHPERQDEAVANAAFIVRAVNSHDALVDALRDMVPVGLADEDEQSALAGESICRWCGRELNRMDNGDVAQCDSDDCPAVKARAALAMAEGRETP